MTLYKLQRINEGIIIRIFETPCQSVRVSESVCLCFSGGSGGGGKMAVIKSRVSGYRY